MVFKEFCLQEEIHESCLGYEFYYGINKIVWVHIFTSKEATQGEFLKSRQNFFMKVYACKCDSSIALLIIKCKYHDIKSWTTPTKPIVKLYV